MRRLAANAAGLEAAAAALKAGQVVAYPTETVYGLGVNPFSPGALDRLFAAKGRPGDKPVLLIVADAAQLAGLVGPLSPAARRAVERCWPGPVSLLLPRHPDLDLVLTVGLPQICVRCPGAEVARHLCRLVGGPITSTSANLSGHEPARSADAIDFAGVDAVVDGGTLPPGPPSTLYEPDTGRVLREGPVSLDALQRLLAD